MPEFDHEKWKTMLVNTHEDKIEFLKYCLLYFTARHLAPTANDNVTLVPSSKDIKISSWARLSDVPLILPTNSVFDCMVCGKMASYHMHASFLANPYSNWMILQCEHCAAEHSSRWPRYTQATRGLRPRVASSCCVTMCVLQLLSTFQSEKWIAAFAVTKDS